MAENNFFEDAMYLPEMIEAKTAYLQELREKATSVGNGAPRLASSKNGQHVDLVAKYAAEIGDLEREIECDIAHMQKVLNDMRVGINMVTDPKLRLFLTLRYLQRMPVSVIAEQMHYSVRWSHTIGAKARTYFNEKVLPKLREAGDENYGN